MVESLEVSEELALDATSELPLDARLERRGRLPTALPGAVLSL